MAPHPWPAGTTVVINASPDGCVGPRWVPCLALGSDTFRVVDEDTLPLFWRVADGFLSGCRWEGGSVLAIPVKADGSLRKRLVVPLLLGSDVMFVRVPVLAADGGKVAWVRTRVVSEDQSAQRYEVRGMDAPVDMEVTLHDPLGMYASVVLRHAGKDDSDAVHGMCEVLSARHDYQARSARGIADHATGRL